jgi:hypothetical protein
VKPGVEVRGRASLSRDEVAALARAGLGGRTPVEAWSVVGTSRQLGYATHGIFRYFGKLPPPLVQKLLLEHTQRGEWVLDPMAGSGTTAVEAQLTRRPAVVRDVSPLSLLLCRVKTTRVDPADARAALGRVRRRVSRQGGAAVEPVGLRHAAHWFLPETRSSLGRIAAAVRAEPDGPARDLLQAALAAAVRPVSRATTLQGRLFLDAASAVADAWPAFAERAERFAAAAAALPRRRPVALELERRDAREPGQGRRRFRLAIVHPPYFNNYKYSSVNALELAWLGEPPAETRRAELREGFKAGRVELAERYLEDLGRVVSAVEAELAPGGVLALVLGDTVIRGEYVAIVRRLLDAVRARGSGLRLTRVVLRTPRYTEASWVASQRRAGTALGVRLRDFVLLMSAEAGRSPGP